MCKSPKNKGGFWVADIAVERRKGELEVLPPKRAIGDSTFQVTPGEQNLCVFWGESCPDGCETAAVICAPNLALLSGMDCQASRRAAHCSEVLGLISALELSCQLTASQTSWNGCDSLHASRWGEIRLCLLG